MPENNTLQITSSAIMSADGTAHQIPLRHPNDPGLSLSSYSFTVASGNFGGGTLKLQVSSDNSTYNDFPGGAKQLTAAGTKSATEGVTAYPYLRLQLTGSTTPSFTVTFTATYMRLGTSTGTSDTPIAEDVTYDNASSGLTANDVQEAIDELASVDRAEGFKVRNETGGAVGAGDLIKITGWSETHSSFLFALCDNENRAAADGVLTGSISNNANGTAYKRARVTGLNTGGTSVGDAVWVSATGTTGNTWTFTQPGGAAQYAHQVGFVAVVHASTGAIEFNVEQPVEKISSEQIQSGAVRNELSNMGGLQLGQYTDNATLAATDAGFIVILADAKTFTLPTDPPEGTRFRFYLGSGGISATINRGGTNLFADGSTSWRIEAPASGGGIIEFIFGTFAAQGYWTIVSDFMQEYDSTSRYWMGQLVINSSTGAIYISLAFNNTGNALTDTTKWYRIPNSPPTTTDNTLPRFDGTTGNLQTSAVAVSDTDGEMSVTNYYAGTVKRLATVTGIDLKAAAATNLYTVPAGKTCVITDVRIRVTAADTVTVAAAVEVGKSAAYDEWIGATTLTGLDTAGEVVGLAEIPSAITVRQTFAAAEVIAINVTTGATATTLTAAVDLLGYLI